jgi:dinuclear metal center YbgI/SA1388 family protein
MRLSELVEAMEKLAPTRNAESWDNVGLLVGDPTQNVSRAILTIDYTAAVAIEARRHKCDLIIAYHPPIFDGLKRITASSLIFQAIRDGVAIYSPHTALDVAEGGTNDMLADAIGLKQRGPLRVGEAKAIQYKLVMFVPENAAEKVSRALFEAGAGRIGDYSQCSFRTAGTGTFFGGKKTSPKVGAKGRREQVAELRLETVAPIAQMSRIIAALRAAHPYEEPAFDLVQLAAVPSGMGQGRIGMLAAPTPRQEIFRRIKRELEIDHLLIAGPTRGKVSKAACCAGACGDMLNDAISQGAELYLTGEMRHHDALRAAEAEVTVVYTLHSNSERAVLKRVAKKLRKLLPALAVRISKADADPFVIA